MHRSPVIPGGAKDLILCLFTTWMGHAGFPVQAGCPASKQPGDFGKTLQIRSVNRFVKLALVHQLNRFII